MIALKEALVNKSNIKNVKRKEKLWILVPDGENPLALLAEYADCANLTANSFYIYVLTTTQIKDVFERYPEWDQVTIYDYNGKLNQDELLVKISKSDYHDGKKFLECDTIDKEKIIENYKMITLKEALVNKSNIKNVKRKEKLWILVPDGENPLSRRDEDEYEECITSSKNNYYIYVFTNEQIKDIFERYPNWNDVVIYEYKGKLDQYELLNDISLEDFEYYNATTFLGGHQISKEKLLKTIK